MNRVFCALDEDAIPRRLRRSAEITCRAIPHLREWDEAV